MKMFIGLLAISITLGTLNHRINAMETPREKETARTPSRSFSHPSSLFTKKLTPPAHTHILKSDPSRSPSPKTTNKHIVWLFDKDFLPREKICLNKGESTPLENFINIFTVYNVNFFLAVSPNDVNNLDEACLFTAMPVMKKFNTVPELLMPQTIEQFCRFLNHNKKKIIAVYGRSDNSTMYKMLACWSIPIITDLVIKRNDKINTANRPYNCSQIFNADNRELFTYLVKHILEFVYQRLIVPNESLDNYLSSDEQDTVKLYCSNYINKIIEEIEVSHSCSSLSIQDDEH